MKKEDRGKIIFDAAVKVFSKKEYASTRRADIAADAGMSYGLVYYYFQNKKNCSRSYEDCPSRLEEIDRENR